MFGVSGGEFVVLVVVAALVLGPRNVAQAMAALRAGLDRLRQFSARLRAETSLTDVDGETLRALRGLDPSRYDPRQIVRQAVREEVRAWMDSAEAGSGKPSPARAGVGSAGTGTAGDGGPGTDDAGTSGARPGTAGAGRADDARSGAGKPGDGPTGAGTAASSGEDGAATDGPARSRPQAD
ncbi:MAG: hypothetical protein Q3979_03255 [Actinomycetaceae bacterium]|nr:hypothetical protein [Actinomycetaceae bacterium]